MPSVWGIGGHSPQHRRPTSIQGKLVYYSSLWLYVSSVTSLGYTPNSKCESLCRSSSSPSSSATSASGASVISMDEISCRDEDYGKATGLRFRECTECLQENPQKGSDQSDLGWLLFNFRYALNGCLTDSALYDPSASGPTLTATSSPAPSSTSPSDEFMAGSADGDPTKDSGSNDHMRIFINKDADRNAGGDDHAESGSEDAQRKNPAGDTTSDGVRRPDRLIIFTKTEFRGPSHHDKVKRSSDQLTFRPRADFSGCPPRCASTLSNIKPSADAMRGDLSFCSPLADAVSDAQDCTDCLRNSDEHGTLANFLEGITTVCSTPGANLNSSLELNGDGFFGVDVNVKVVNDDDQDSSESSKEDEDSDEKGGGGGVPTKAIIGGVLGGVFGLGLIVGLLLFFWKRNKDKKAHQQSLDEKAYASEAALGKMSPESSQMYDRAVSTSFHGEVPPYSQHEVVPLQQNSQQTSTLPPPPLPNTGQDSQYASHSPPLPPQAPQPLSRSRSFFSSLRRSKTPSAGDESQPGSNAGNSTTQSGHTSRGMSIFRRNTASTHLVSPSSPGPPSPLSPQTATLALAPIDISPPGSPVSAISEVDEHDRNLAHPERNLQPRTAALNDDAVSVLSSLHSMPSTRR